MNNFYTWGFNWKIQFLGGVHKKTKYRWIAWKGGLGLFVDLRGAWQKRGWYPNLLYDNSPPYVSGITGKILIMIIRFACHYLLLASKSTFMTHSQYLVIIQIWGNLNEYHYYLTSTKFPIFQTDPNCSPFQSPFYVSLESLKLI